MAAYKANNKAPGQALHRHAESGRRDLQARSLPSAFRINQNLVENRVMKSMQREGTTHHATVLDKVPPSLPAFPAQGRPASQRCRPSDSSSRAAAAAFTPANTHVITHVPIKLSVCHPYLPARCAGASHRSATHLSLRSFHPQTTQRSTSRALLHCRCKLFAIFWGLGISCTLRDLANLPKPCPITLPQTTQAACLVSHLAPPPNPNNLCKNT